MGASALFYVRLATFISFSRFPQFKKCARGSFGRQARDGQWPEAINRQTDMYFLCSTLVLSVSRTIVKLLVFICHG
jgi:hypothetical protein